MVRLKMAAILPLLAGCSLALGFGLLVPPTAEILKGLKSQDLTVRRKAARDIIRLNPDLNVDWFDRIGSALTKAIEDKDSEVGEAAALGFSRIRTGCYPPNDRLFELLDSTRPEVVRRAVTALWMSESQAFKNTHANLVLAEAKSTSAQKLAALKELGKEGSFAGYEQTLILNACKDSNLEVRLNSLRLLGKAQCSEAHLQFLTDAHDSDPKIRMAAMQAMDDTCDETFRQTLRSARQDKDSAVAALAKKLCSNLPSSERQDLYSGQRAPRFYDAKIGPYTLNQMSSISMMNPRRTRFFVKGGECDGACSWIAISSEPGATQIPDALHDMVECSVPDYKTGKGIGLGDTRESVQKKLGKPTRVSRKNGRTIDVYRDGTEDDYYEALYRYFGDRLVGICLGRYSDEG